MGTVFLGALGMSQDSNNPWKIWLKLNTLPVEMKIDAGAEVSVILESLGLAVGRAPDMRSGSNPSWDIPVSLDND
jgi:hypothetical protein